MNRILILIGLLFTFSHCTETGIKSETDEPVGDALTIRTGTSFGMCVGYCVNDYSFNGTLGQLTQLSHRNDQPTKMCAVTISQTDWNALKTAADFETFKRQPESLGCPDCADGGAEYVELQIGDQKHRVTFEYGETIPGFETLIDALRKQRAALPECK